jgi:hypothetical protein
MQDRVRTALMLASASGVCLACGTAGHRDVPSDSPGSASVASEVPASARPDPLWSGWQYPDCEAGRLELILDQHCSACHVRSFVSVPIDCFGSYCDPQPVFFSELIAEGRVIPGDAERSRLLVRVRNSSMPPPYSRLEPLSAEQVDDLATFIDSLDPTTKTPECDPEVADIERALNATPPIMR